MRLVVSTVWTCSFIFLVLQLGCSGAVAQSSNAASNSAGTAATQLTVVSPTSVAVGHGALLLTAQGTNFSAESVIVWNGAAQPTTFVSSEELTAQIPASALTKASAISVAVKNSQSGGESNSLSITIGAPPEITTTALPAGHAGSTYSAPIAVSGGVPPFRWSMASGNLPAGLAINSNTGIISGTATEPGDNNVSVLVTDSVNSSARQVWPSTSPPPARLPLQQPQVPLPFTDRVLARTAWPTPPSGPKGIRSAIDSARNIPVTFSRR